MKKIILTSITCMLGLSLFACSNKTTKKTTKQSSSSTTTKTTTNKNTTTTTTKQKSYNRVGNDIYFGSYPQELVSDSSKIEELDTNTSGWISYKYYSDDGVLDYMLYKDVDIDNDGKYDYRGVKFSEFRPYLTSQESYESLSYQDENGYEVDKTYWFKYSPIKWNILREDNIDIMIASELLIDAQEIYYDTNNGKFDHNDGNGYCNNYALSNIRKWLNDSFYNLAFTELEKEDIKTRSVYTDATPNKYSSGMTEDNIFLLDKNESSLYYTSDETRRAKGTDYAKVQGLHVNESIVNNGYSEWWVRTPSFNSDYSTITIDTDGTINGNGIVDSNTSMGIRVACLLYA